MNTINERITTVLKEKAFKQKDLCKSIGVPTSTLNTWLKQGRSVPSEFLVSICEFLDISVNWLLTGEGDMGISTPDIRPTIYDTEELDTAERLLLSNYKKLDENSKVEVLNIVTLKTLKSSKSKLYSYPNISRNSRSDDETSASYESQGVA